MTPLRPATRTARAFPAKVETVLRFGNATKTKDKPMGTQRSMAREFGTALAVLAIYLLTILAPLHQARASQLDFEKLGYETIATNWALCGAPDSSHDSDTGLVVKCPAAGIGKQDLVEPDLAVLPVEGLAIDAAYAPISVSILDPLATLNPAAPPRAPPASA